ncbi:MAG: nucleobase:cation symporter-2 family protein [Lachnospiraceae bacterium]|nr:nucleobase:cation symporter-2 family protein [Lachnospiraceae bacterium]
MNKFRKGEPASVFQMEGIPKISVALPLAVQHVVAMIVGCVTPSLIIAGVTEMPNGDKVILVQAALVIAALSTLIQLFPLFGKLGSGLPVMLGVGFAFLPSLKGIAEGYNISTIFGAQIVGGIVALIVGIFVKKLRYLFPPLITGTVVFTIGLSLYPTAINYMAGGSSNPNYGSWQNWLVAITTLIAVTIFNHFCKGILKLASILMGMAVGYVVAGFFGMISFNSVIEAGAFQLPQFMHFGISFEISSCVALGILFAVNAIQAIGDYSATTIGGLDREPTGKELQSGIMAYGISNVFGAFIGGLPTSTYSQNVGIVATTKVVNRCVLGMAAGILLIAGLVPKFSAVLTTIPQAVLGGATVSVFASIAMTGMKLVASQPMTYRNTSIVGLSAALGIGITQVTGALAGFPDWVTSVFAKSPVVVATLVAVALNIILPKEDDQQLHLADDTKRIKMAQTTDEDVISEEL